MCSISDSAGTLLCLRAASIWNEIEITRLAVEWARYLKATNMPRYFFHLRFGRRFLPDDEGIELRNRTAARDEALAVVRDLTNPKIKGGRQRWASWFLEVAG